MANTELSNKISSLKRYGVTAGATALTVLSALQLLSPEHLADLKTQADIFNHSIYSAYGALTHMWLIVGPVMVGIAVKMGWNSSSVKALGDKLFGIAANAKDPASTEAKVVIVTAAASPAIGSQGVVNPEMAANPATPGNVVATASQLPK